jgi:UDP-N-acetylglucosamine acyltransferase
MTAQVHRFAAVEEGAQLGAGCRVGPFCHLGPNVVLGKNNVLHAGVVIDGHTIIGDGNELFPYACIGKTSQDLKFNREWVSYSRIGNGNVFREYVTVNASSREGGSTVIGDNCLFLSYSHVAHDCVLGDNVIISSDSKLAGHVEVGHQATISAKTGVVQFVRIGEFAFVGGFNKVTKDILPYCLADGFPSAIRAVNKIGLERNGFPPEKVRAIRDAFQTMIRSELTLDAAIAQLRRKYSGVPEIERMIEFASSSETGLARPRKSAMADEGPEPGG